MRVAAVGVVLLLAGLVLASWNGDGAGRVWAQNTAVPTGQFAVPGNLLALSSDRADGPQQVTLVDTQKRVMSVYHIDRATGEITLKSVRSVHWDLLMEEFNGQSPLPREIRRLLEHR